VILRHHACLVLCVFVHAFPEAVLLGQRMETAVLLHHVSDEHVFLDKDLFYRFYADEEEGEVRVLWLYLPVSCFAVPGSRAG
jgi:hypothetical protein